MKKLIAVLFGIVLFAGSGCRIGHHGLQWFWAPDPPSWTGTYSGGDGQLTNLYLPDAIKEPKR